MDSRQRTLAISMARSSDGTRQSGGGHRAGSRRPDGGDLPRVDDRDGSAGFRIEQNHESLVGRSTRRRIPLEDRDQLGAEWRMRTQGARHDAQQAPFGQWQNGPQKLFRFPLREGDHGIAHDGNTEVVRSRHPRLRAGYL
jgi:hypothetical protein